MTWGPTSPIAVIDDGTSVQPGNHCWLPCAHIIWRRKLLLNPRVRVDITFYCYKKCHCLTHVLVHITYNALFMRFLFFFFLPTKACYCMYS